MKSLFFAFNPLIVAPFVVATACSPAPSPEGQDETTATSSVVSSGSGDSMTADSGRIDLTTGSGTTGVVDPSDTRELPLRSQVCDDAGSCTCLKLALLGSLESGAANKDAGPFVDWLTGNSGGSAVVDMISTKPTLNAEFLNQYDILVVANVSQWSFSADEKAAVASWSQESGGGIITLTGFVSNAAEAASSSQLIEFSGVSYTSTIAAEGGQGQVPVYYKDDLNTDRSKCLSSPQNRDAQITTSIRFEPLESPFENLTTNLDYVGAFIGFGVNAPEDATVVATDPMSKQPIAVAKEVNQKGRVFAWGDEWVIFKNQWEDPGPPDDTNMNENNVCWQPTAGDGAGFFHTVQTLYQSKQFWYNIINWVAPPNECFVIEDDEVEVVIR